MNKPNILSNDLDQVPKTRKRYPNELYADNLKQQIIQSFDTHKPLWENDFLVEESDEKVLSRFEKNQENLPIPDIVQMLKDYNTVSCEVHRRKKEKITWFSKAIWPAIPKDNINVWKVLTRNSEELEGNILTYIIFQKMKNNPLTVKISAKQIEFPGEWVLLPEYIVFSKELAWEEFEKEHVTL